MLCAATSLSELLVSKRLCAGYGAVVPSSARRPTFGSCHCHSSGARVWKARHTAPSERSSGQKGANRNKHGKLIAQCNRLEEGGKCLASQKRDILFSVGNRITHIWLPHLQIQLKHHPAKRSFTLKGQPWKLIPLSGHPQASDLC